MAGSGLMVHRRNWPNFSNNTFSVIRRELRDEAGNIIQPEESLPLAARLKTSGAWVVLHK